jgi:hypothetical protein
MSDSNGKSIAQDPEEFFIALANPEQTANVLSMLQLSVELGQKSNREIAELLLAMWANMNMFSFNAVLIFTAMERLTELPDTDLDLSEHEIMVKCGDCGFMSYQMVFGEDLGSPMFQTGKGEWTAPGPCMQCVEDVPNV